MQCCVNVVADLSISVEFNLRAAAVTRDNCHQSRPKQTAALKRTGATHEKVSCMTVVAPKKEQEIKSASPRKSSFSLAATVTHTQLNTNLLTHLKYNK